MNTAKAAGLVANDATNGLKNFVKEVMLVNGTFAQFPVVSAGTNGLRRPCAYKSRQRYFIFRFFS
jgi:hypothetical protein